MADFGIKISKPGIDVKGEVTEATKKNFIILSTAESHKVAIHRVMPSSDTQHTHNLGYIPFVQAYYEDTNGDLYPMGAIDSQVYDHISMRFSTSVIFLSRYESGSERTKYYIIYYEG